MSFKLRLFDQHSTQTELKVKFLDFQKKMTE